MNRRILFFIILYLSGLHIGHAQDSPCYDPLVQEGLINRDSLKNYKTAVRKFMAAGGCLDAPPQSDDLVYLIDNTLTIWRDTLVDALNTTKQQRDSLGKFSITLKEQRDSIKRQGDTLKIYLGVVQDQLLLNYSNRLADKANEYLGNEKESKEGFTLAFHAYDTLYKRDKKILPSVSKAFGAFVYQEIADKYQQDTSYIRKIILSPDSLHFLTIHQNKAVYIWSIKNGVVSQKIKHHDYILSVDFSPKGDKIVTACRDGNVLLWNLKGEFIRTITTHDKAVVQVLFSPQGDKILTASRDGTAKVFNIKGKFLDEVKHSSGVQEVSFLKNGKTVLSRSMRELLYWEIGLSKKAYSFDHKDNLIYRAVLSEDKKWLLTCSNDSTARFWNMHSLSIEDSKKYNSEIYEAQFLLKNRNILGTKKGQLIIRKNLESTIEENNDFIHQINISPKSSNVLVLTGKGQLLFWPAHESLSSDSEQFNKVFLSKNNKRFLTITSNGRVRLWDYNRNLLMEVGSESRQISEAVFSLDSRYLILGTTKGEVSICPTPNYAYEIITNNKKAPSVDKGLRKVINDLFVNELE